MAYKIHIVFLSLLFPISNGLLTDFEDDYGRVVSCSGSGYFDTVIPVFSHNTTALAGVGLSCSSGYAMIEGKGKVTASKDEPYYFGQQYDMNVNQQFFHKSGACADQSAISKLEFTFQGTGEPQVVNVQLGCTSLQDTGNQSVQTVYYNQLLGDSGVQQNQNDIMSCQNGNIVNAFKISWREEPEYLLDSMDVINCRKVKQQQQQCAPGGQVVDVSCQGVGLDCCTESAEKGVFSCDIAGSVGVSAWFTSEELQNTETHVCENQDELTSGWFQIKASTGICMDAITATEGQFSGCQPTEHQQWFRFVGGGTFKQLESGEFVGKCLNLKNKTEDDGSIFLPTFDIVPCSQSITEWNWADGVGLSMQQKGPVVARTKDIFPNTLVLGVDQDGSIVMRSFLDTLTAQAESVNGGNPRQRSYGRQAGGQPQLKEGEIPGLSPQAPTPSNANSIFLPPVEASGNWIDESSQLEDILTQMLNDSSLASSFVGNISNEDDPSVILTGPAYCDKQEIVCDHTHRIMVLQFDSSTFQTDVAGTLSPSLFDLPKLRNFRADNMGLAGELPSAANGSQLVVGPPVIRQISLANNQFSGDLPTDWPILDSLVRVNLLNNANLRQVASSWLQLRVFGIPTVIDIDQKLCSSLDVACDKSEILGRFPCLQSQCAIPITTTSQTTDNGESHTPVIIGTVIPVFIVFVVVVFVMYFLVMRRRRQLDWGRMTTDVVLKQDSEKGLGKPQNSGRLTPPKQEDISGQFALPQKPVEPSSLLERYLQDEGVVTWNTPPQYVVDWEIDYERDLVAKGTLGVGAMGSVQLAEWTDRKSGDKKLVAVKVFSRYLQPIYKDAVEVLNQKLILREVEILMRVEHPNIVKCLGAILKPPNMGLVLEYMDVGNLDKYLHNICSAHPLNDRDKLIIMKQIARALDHLHPSVVHRDLKPQNILINSKGEIKLSDFGLSKIRQLQDAGRASSLQVLGTAPYTSPEVFRSNGLNVEDEKVDIYSLGVIMWEIWSMLRPWDGENMVAISYKVVNEGRRPPMPNNIPLRLKNLIESCWDDDPKRRPSARDVQRMLEWMIEENNFNESKYQQMREQEAASGSLDGESVAIVVKGDSADHINVPADENHESVCISFIFPDGNTYEGKFDWRDSLLLLTDEVNDMLGYPPDGDTSRFRLHRIIEIEEQDPQVVEMDLTSISDTLQQHRFYTRNKIYVETLQEDNQLQTHLPAQEY